MAVKGRYRYYSTQRPLCPGAFPKPQGNKVLEVKNFDGKTCCGEIGKQAWGYIEYELPVSPVLLENFELMEAGR